MRFRIIPSLCLVTSVGLVAAACGSESGSESPGPGAQGGAAGNKTGGSSSGGSAQAGSAQGGSAQAGSSSGGSLFEPAGGSNSVGGNTSQGGAAGSLAAGGSGGSNAGSGGAGGASPEAIRFVALGDAGEGNPRQYQVGQAMKDVCDQHGGCHFALYLGDNFYDSGVDSATDNQFETKFELPYKDLHFPFYISLGNHDYGVEGAGLLEYKRSYYLQYAQNSAKWYMPSQYFKVSHPGLDLYSLDTNFIFLAGGVDQLNWLRSNVAASSAKWKIAFGHHPYISNGRHGNAGTYEGIPLIPIISGQNVKTFVEEGICGDIDIFIAGHDHNMQWLQPKCGTEFIVSGSGAKMTGLEGRGSATFFETDQIGGFFLGEIDGDRFTGWFYDENSQELYTRTITKP